MKFDIRLFAHQVVVAETFNPGSISKIYLYDTDAGEHLVYENEKTGPLSGEKQLLVVKFPQKTRYKVRGAKIVMKTSSVKGYNGIDAIGIYGAEDKIKIEVEQPKGVVFDSKAENLGKNVNSPYDDYIPQISPDGKILYFARYDHPKNMGGANDIDIWFSKLVGNNTWSVAEPMPKPLNDKTPNSLMTITPDGNTILLNTKYNQDGSHENGVSLSTKRRNDWKFPKPVVIKDFYTQSEYAEYCIGASKKVMLMSLDRPEGYGETDLYVSKLNKNKTWSKPINLGEVINTADVEMSPFLAADGITLYFASAGHRGYGKEDIFMTKRLDDTWLKWSKPINLGPVINSNQRDGYYSIPASGEYAYFISKKQTIGRSDIFRIKLPDAVKPSPTAIVYGTVYNGKTKETLEAELIYELQPEGLEMGIATSNASDGGYKIALPMGDNYTIFAIKDKFISVNETVDLTDTTKHYMEVKRDIYLYPLEEGVGFQLKNVKFERSKFELLPSSFPELDRLYELLVKYPEMEILLEGHTDNTGNPKLNEELSLHRVEEVKKYLVSEGIKARRIQLEGHGGSKPIASNGRETTRKMNRRVELKILKY